MFKKYTFIFLVFCCLALFNIFTTPPKPTQAYGVIGEPCSIWYVDTHTPGWPFVESRWVESCPIDCFGDIAGDYHRPDVAWCEASVPPPNLPGIMLGEYCSAESSRTVQLNIMGTLGTHFEIEGPTGVFDATTYTFTTLAEGENQFRARAHNAGGSSEWTEWVTVAHDYSAPITTPQIVGLMGDNNWYTSPVTVSFMANDAQCFGVSQTVYEVNGISADYSGVPFTMDAEGVNTLTFHSTDGYHPETPQSVSIQIDSLPPTLAITPDRPFDVSSGWWNAPISLHITSGDATSGVLTTEYNLNLAGWTAGDSVTLSADGVQELDAQVTDYAGHLTYDGVVIPIDSTAPALMVALSGEKGLLDWFITPPSLSIHATDATSGVLAILYQVDSGAQELYTSSLNFVREGLYTVQAFAVDVAQNITTQTFQVGYDITPPQTTATLTEIDGGMTVTLTGWDAVSGVKTIRMAINGVWGEYHHPMTVTGVGEYWIQYFTTDFAGNIEAEKITSFTISETGVVVIQNPPVVNIVPPANPPNTPPFETRDDFPPDLHDENVYYVSPPPNKPPFETADDFPPNLHDESVYYVSPPAVTNPPTLHGDRHISRLPVIRNTDNTSLVVTNHPIGHPPRLSTLPYSDANRGINNTSFKSEGIGNDIRTIPRIIRDDAVGTRSDPIRVSPIHYVEHPIAFTPTQTTIISDPTTGSSVPENTPLDMTMLAMLGLTIAGAGAMKTQTATQKQKEQAQANAVAQAQLATAKTQQAQIASAYWEHNQMMQANATKKVYTKVQQSQANIDFWASYTAWKIKAAEAEQKRLQAEQKRQQAELEARMKAYYATLRSNPVSSQPVQPMTSLWATLITRARANQRNNRNNASQSGASSSAGSGSNGGSSNTSKPISSADNAKMVDKNKGGGFLGLGAAGIFTAGASGGNVDTTGVGSSFSYGWGNNNLQVSQENRNTEDACERSDQFELFGYLLTGLITLATSPRGLLQESAETFLNSLSNYAMPSIAVPLAHDCGGESGVLNEIANTVILGGFSYLGFPLVGLGLVITKELVMGSYDWYRPEYNVSITTVEENESALGIRPDSNCPIDPYHTLGDQIVNYAEPFYPYSQGFPSTWDDGDIRFGYAQNPQPVTQILENNQALAGKIDWLINAINNDPENGSVMVQHFDTEFSNLMMSQSNISDILYEYPLIGQTTLIHYLANEGHLNAEIQSAIENHLLELGVSNPSNFIDSIVNNSPDFQSNGICN